MCIRDRSYTLNKGTDYTVIYEDNKKVGTATVIFTGTGNFKGFHVENFTIRPKSTILRKLIKGKKQFSVVWKKQTTQTVSYTHLDVYKRQTLTSNAPVVFLLLLS